MYRSALDSPHWRNLSRQVRIQRGNRCEACGAWAVEKRLELHHLHYDTLGREQARDVKLLCADCHREADTERVRTARFDAWFRHRYGNDPDWRDRPGYQP
jgi:hypothetical protein